jgi:hypothetical protein
VLVSDCANVVKNTKGTAMGHYGQIVQEIKAAATCFQSIKFIHERRESNVDAHNLARSCLYKGLGRHVWFISAPMGIVTHTLLLLNKVWRVLLKKALLYM